MPQRLDRIERIGKPAPTSGPRHELGDALCSLGADSPCVKTALLPDHPGKELDGKGVLRRRLLQGMANLVWTLRLRGCTVLVARRIGAFPVVTRCQCRACLCIGGRVCQSERKREQWSGYAEHRGVVLTQRQKNARGGGLVPPSTLFGRLSAYFQVLDIPKGSHFAREKHPGLSSIPWGSSCADNSV